MKIAAASDDCLRALLRDYYELAFFLHGATYQSPCCVQPCCLLHCEQRSPPDQGAHANFWILTLLASTLGVLAY